MVPAAQAVSSGPPVPPWSAPLPRPVVSPGPVLPVQAAPVLPVGAVPPVQAAPGAPGVPVTAPPVGLPLPVTPVPGAPAPEIVALLDGGLGAPPPHRIAVLPPVEQLDLGPRLSARTGEPVRPRLLWVALGCFYLAAGVSAVTLAAVWWRAIHMTTWDHAARIIELLDPRPGKDIYAGGWESILAAVLMVAIGAITVAAPWLAAFNAWGGERWTRVFGLVCAGIAGLAWFVTTGRPTFSPWSQWLTWVPWLAVPACLAGGILLWLAPVTRFFADVSYVRHPAAPPSPATSGIAYGPLERYR